MYAYIPSTDTHLSRHPGPALHRRTLDGRVATSAGWQLQHASDDRGDRPAVSVPRSLERPDRYCYSPLTNFRNETYR
ncbi:hypothetical protein GCM10028856_19460 [Halopiger thermotolerans]